MTNQQVIDSFCRGHIGKSRNLLSLGITLLSRTDGTVLSQRLIDRPDVILVNLTPHREIMVKTQDQLHQQLLDIFPVVLDVIDAPFGSNIDLRDCLNSFQKRYLGQEALAA